MKDSGFGFISNIFIIIKLSSKSIGMWQTVNIVIW